MKRTLACLRVASLVLLSTALQPADAQSRCAKPDLTRVESVACAKGKEDIEALRRYVWRTRMIYNLYMPHYAPERMPPATAAADAKEPRDARHDIASASR